jgi:4-diphosphocytidyl-2-C-methyl-D-erythritol kinase
MPRIAGRALAKVNLALRVLNRRPDGFHEIRTLFQTISPADRISVEYRPRGRQRVSLHCNEPALEGEENLAAWRGGIHIDLEKRIPSGAGLGGGSSDAAAVLRALSLLLSPAPAPHTLFDLACELGSDVPFFLLGGRAVGVGRGTEVYPLPDAPRAWVVVGVPPVHVATADAYRDLRRSRGQALTAAARNHIIRGFCRGISVPADGEALRLAGALPTSFVNDFEDVIFRRFPVIEGWKNRLAQLGASPVMLSGSGSAVFGLFSDRTKATKAYQALRALEGKVFIGHTVTRRAYRSALRSKAPG